MMRLVDQGMREWGIALHGVGNNIDEAKQSIEEGYRFPQTLYMSCGHKMTFHSAEKLPNQNIPCPCGNPNHWIVKYDILTRRKGLKDFFLRLFKGRV